MKILAAVLLSLSIGGCATMTPEQQRQFVDGMAAGAAAYNAGARPYEREHQEIHCTSTRIGDFVDTTCR